MMCEAASSLNTLTLPSCTDGDYTVECGPCGVDDSNTRFFLPIDDTTETVEDRPKVKITFADFSNDSDCAAGTSSNNTDTKCTNARLAIPLILTTTTDEVTDVQDAEIATTDDEQVQRFLSPAEKSLSTNTLSTPKEKFIARLRRSASFSSPYKLDRRLSQDSNTPAERKQTIFTRTLSFIKNKMDFASTSTLYPSKEEIRKWQQSFEKLLSHKYGCLIFREFLKTEVSAENLDFWLECEDFKKMKEGKKSTQQKAFAIYKQYIEVDAPREVNIDANVRMATKVSLDNGAKPCTFLLAQNHIEQLMEKDSYRRFLNSEKFRQLLNE